MTLHDNQHAAGLPSPVRPSSVVGADGVMYTWRLACEVPVEIDIDGEPIAVLLASPTDIAELALGFAWSEGLLRRRPTTPTVDIHTTADGIVANLRVDADSVDRQRLGERKFAAGSGCGLCGLADLAALRRRVPEPTRNSTVLDDDALERAFAALNEHQPLNRVTHSVHAAAWCDLDGRIQAVREDIGRHNALDKLLGAQLFAEPAATPGFVLLTSRLSFELVYKAHALGAIALATISAPTTLALDLASQLGLAVYCLADAAPDGSSNRRIVRCLG